MKRSWIVKLCLVALFLLTGGKVAAAAPVVLFIPLDDRPVCLADTVATARAAGVDVVVPPAEWLASRYAAGDPERLWQWLKEEAPRADAAVISVDSLVYGGLVPSRTHALSDAMIDARRNRLAQLKNLQPALRVYAFSTLMRSPKATAGAVDAWYYEKWGPDIFRLGALTDKRDSDGLNPLERSEIQQLVARIPNEYLADWRERRAKNIRNNLALWDMTQAGNLDYLLLGRDDAWPYSDSRRDLRWLLAQREERPDPSRFATMAAADQLGMLLLVRAANQLANRVPFIAAIYDGAGPAMVPSYQDETAGANIAAQIWASGAYPVAGAERADLVLAVHTLPDGRTREAASPANDGQKNAAVAALGDRIAAWQQSGKPVAVADIAYANGADNALMRELASRRLIKSLAAYSGWNTASNSAGFALGQGQLATQMEETQRLRLLAVRLLDDWCYQANVRQQVATEVLLLPGVSTVRLGTARAGVEGRTTAGLREFAKRNLTDFPLPQFQARHPWDRLFEVKIEFDE